MLQFKLIQISFSTGLKSYIIAYINKLLPGPWYVGILLFTLSWDLHFINFEMRGNHRCMKLQRLEKRKCIY